MGLGRQETSPIGGCSLVNVVFWRKQGVSSTFQKLGDAMMSARMILLRRSMQECYASLIRGPPADGMPR